MRSKWWKESVVYQIYPRSFMDSNGDGIGDLKGIISQLDYLQELGIDVIWLSPVYESPNDDNGYDISNYQEIMNEFGTMEDMDKLLEEAHFRGIRIVMDLVVNHTSDEHAWFLESKNSKTGPYRDFYIWKEGKGEEKAEPNNWGGSFGGSAWQWDKETEMFYLHLYSVKQPDLNWENPLLRKKIYEMMTWWLEKGIDGFRMDVINLIAKDPSFRDAPSGKHMYGDFYPLLANEPKVHGYLKEMHREVLSKYDIMTVGEMPLVNLENAQRYTWEAEEELDMVFHFEHMGLDNGEYGRWSDRKVSLPDLKKVLSKWQIGLYDRGWNSLYWNNHDQPRVVSRFGNDKEYRIESAKMLATCLHFMQGTPYVYQGEELGMTNVAFKELYEYQDIDTLNSYQQYVNEEDVPHEDMMRYIHRRSRDNARTPMQWNDSDHAGFTIGVPWIKVNPNYIEINAKQQLHDVNSVFHYYKKLIQLRKEIPAMVHGRYELFEEEHESLYIYKRSYERELSGKKETDVLHVLCNFSDLEQEYEIHLPDTGYWLIENYPLTVKENKIILKPYEARVYYESSLYSN